MNDYISREAAVKIADKYGCANGSVLGHHSGAADCISSEIASLPAADVESVRHGAWYQCFEDWRQQQEGNKCSACGFEYYGTGIRAFHYCPNCCAKMDLI